MGLVLHADIALLTVIFDAGAIILIGLFIYFKVIKREKKQTAPVSWEINAIIFRAIVLLQIFVIMFTAIPYIKSDITVETVNSFLSTGLIYSENPLNGGAVAVPMRLKVLCLPTIYAFLCRVFHAEAVTVVWRAVPVVVLLLSYVAFSSLSKTLFRRSSDRTLFMLVVGALLSAGCYAYGMEGFLLLFAGWQGNTIRAMVLMPATLNFAIKKQWILCALMVVTESMIVWTFYGAGFCLVEALFIFVITKAFEIYRKKSPEVHYD